MDRHLEDLLTQIAASLAAIRVVTADNPETALHAEIASALTRNGHHWEHEVSLAPRNRIDFVVERVIGIEVKTGLPTRATVLPQLRRYAMTRKLNGIILVAERRISVPEDLHGVSVRSTGLLSNWGLAA